MALVAVGFKGSEVQGSKVLAAGHWFPAATEAALCFGCPLSSDIYLLLTNL